MSKPKIPKASDFEQEVSWRLQDAALRGARHADLRAADIYRAAGGYPGEAENMSVCCKVMRRSMRNRDYVLVEPPERTASDLVIRYVF